MSNLTLFDLAEQVRSVAEEIDPETGEVLPVDSGKVRALFEQKAVACVAYAKDTAAKLDAAEAMIDQMRATLARKRASLEGFKGYLLDCMRATGTFKVEGAGGVFSAILYPERDTSVELEDGAIFPPELCADPKPPAPSKTKIKAAILAGQPIKGAHLVKRDRLTIR